MKKFGGYDSAEAYKEQERLPVGAYILKILSAEEKSYDWGSVLIVSFDIDDGDYEGHYQADYKAQTNEYKKWKGNIRINLPKEDGSEKDGWTLRAFKTTIAAIEESNSGFHWDWDEKKLKGKLIGGLFRNKEYEYNGKTRFFTECCRLISVDAVKKGKYKLPEDKLLTNKTSNSSPLFDAVEEKLPWEV
jgi:hypothetical protein